MQKILLIAVAGGFGALARYGLAGWIHRIYPGEFPLGTLGVNLSGCLLFGLLWALTEQRWPISGETRIILLVGFMGAFTTFSTYVFETGQLLKDSEWFLAALNFSGQNVLGLIGLFAGFKIGQIL